MIPRSRSILVPALLGLAGCAARPTDPASPAPLPDLAAAFGERLHGFTPLAPSLRGAHDVLVNAKYDAAGRLVLSSGGVLESQPLRWATPFDELLLSWNAAVPAGAGLVVEVSVESVARGERSPWLYLGGWGATPPADERVTEFDGGKVAVDIVTCTRPFDAFRYRLRAIGSSPEPVVVHATAACLTDTARLDGLDGGRVPQSGLALAVPARSQRLAEEALAPRICSPTSVAMVLAYNGVDVPLEQLAAELHDADHDIYGNWPRAVQGAFAHGVPGTLVRISSWNVVAGFLERDIPLVISVKAEEGELRGAPYPRTSGHLLVLRGLSDDGRRVLVNDPAAPDLESVPREYSVADLERCWMWRGGVAYAIGPRPR